VMKKEKLFEAFVISILILAFFGVLGLGILATLLRLTRGCFERNGIDIKGTLLMLSRKRRQLLLRLRVLQLLVPGGRKMIILPATPHCPVIVIGQW